MADSEGSSTSQGIVPEQNNPLLNPAAVDESIEPIKKKARTDGSQALTSIKISEKLEQRLGGILCCTVCLDLPRSAVYQCTNGHLMCAGCFTHLLADARLREEVATCPNCRIEISKHTASRNLAVEKAVNELPAECSYCNREFPRNVLDRHERELCEDRTVKCKYYRIGCLWNGKFAGQVEHENNCSHPGKTAGEVMVVLREYDDNAEKERKLCSCIFDLLSFEKITLNDLQLKPYRTDEFVHKLYYETSRFAAFNNQWVVKARVNSHQRDPTQSCERELTYQLLLKTKPSNTLSVNFVVLKGPFGEFCLRKPQINHFEFSENNLESPFYTLFGGDSNECNRLLSAKMIHCRLILFLG
ncbi:unnamed protein product [Allacma fusca]|uniref:Cysteine and histidine-rich protein 1 n=1 Tax=Allacma fusca TaxID=39272 RepID=A0A8J2PVZ3_9HEXA|nr:unnamed protein product [Allacma fusca]